MLRKFEIPELDKSDISGGHRYMLPAVNVALRNYAISRIILSSQVPPSRIEPKLKTLACGGTVRSKTGSVWDAVELELARARSQLGVDDEQQIAARAAANVRLRIEFNKKRHGKRTNKGDRDMVRLVAFLASHWIEKTGELPTITNTETLEKSEFLDFVSNALESFQSKITPELAEIAPTLISDLKRKTISFDALHGVFRRSGISQLRKELQKLI